MAENEVSKTNSTKVSKKVSGVLGYDSHFWEQWMLGSLAVVGLVGVAVALFTAAVVISQRRENAETHADFEKYKVETGKDIAEANERAAQANLVAENEKLARLKLEAQLAPRSIVQAQQEELSAKLSSFKSQVVTLQVSPATSEAEWFMRNLAAPLKDAGWTIVMLPSDPSPTWLNPRGVIIQYASQPSGTDDAASTSNAASHALAEYLTSVGIAAHAIGLPHIGGNVTIAIIITDK
ncbi:hypothetical protein [Aestuariivirga litoralis]|uniref:hypothetical protein n=1 Tax=Aestuariivirga litoralis TaxID=2650924 RepID=UPI0018C742A4|nr:hypothetical protein [Aestuariivirga litoralis]MBG1233991.1 hypothetical protein [Aestuariivirga litoralis]